MPFCSNCGKTNAESFRFCSQCGEALTAKDIVTPSPVAQKPTGRAEGIQKALKKVGRIALIIGTVGVVLLILAVGIRIRPFPLEMLEIRDATLHYDDRNPKGFSLRVTNKADVGVTDLRIRLDIIGEDKQPIDGTVFHFQRSVPPGSTRDLFNPWIGLGLLPPEGTWSFTYRVQSAHKVPPWGTRLDLIGETD